MATGNPLRGQNGALALWSGASAASSTAYAPGNNMTNQVFNIVSWELTDSQGIADVTLFGDTARRHKTTPGRWSARATGQWVANDDNTNQDELWKSILQRSSTFVQGQAAATFADSTDFLVSGHFYVDGESATQLAYYGLMLVTEAVVRQPVEGVTECDFTFAGHGELGYVAV